jgi:uncharacterized protein YbjT (DUF2867 family)
MKVLIYGATGFVGKYIVKQLLEKVELFLPVRDINKVKDTFSSFSNLKLIELQSEIIEKPVEDVKPDIVINLIGILKESRNQTYEKVHFEIPKKLIDSSTEVGIKKFIQMSALGADINSKSRYAKTKAMAEEYLKNSGLDYVIFRPSLITGKEQKLFEDLKKYAKFTPFLLAPYDAKVQPVHILDVAESFEKATLEQDIKNETFELCGDRVVSYKELFEFALGYLNLKRFIIPVPKKFFKFLVPPLSFLPDPPLTWDLYYMLEQDNVCSGRYKGVKDLLGKIRAPFQI